MSRRHDHALRSAINRMRQKFHTSWDYLKVFESCLQEALSLTNSSFGFILQKRDALNANNTEILISKEPLRRNLLYRPIMVTELVAKPVAKSIKEQANPIQFIQHKQNNFFALADFISQCQSLLIMLQPLYLCGDELSEYKQHFPSCWPRIKQLLLTPFVDQKKSIAWVAITDIKPEDEIEITKRLWPLINEAVQLLKLGESPKPLTSAHHFIDFRDNNLSQTPHTHSAPITAEQQLKMRCHYLENHSLDTIIEINDNHKITRFNYAAEEMFGIEVTSAIGRELTQFIPERFPNEHRINTFSNTKLPEDQNFTESFLARRIDSSLLFPIDMKSFAHEINKRIHHVLFIRDKSELQHIRFEQEEQMQRFKAVSDLAPVGILQTNAEWECIYANDRWCDICGYSATDVINMGWLNAIHNEDVTKTLETLRQAMIAGDEFDSEFRLQTPLGETAWVEMHSRPLFNQSGSIDGFLATLVDVTFHHKAEEKLRSMAEKDALTGLASRALFQERLQRAIDSIDRKGALVLLCLDLDGFKVINDTLGHDAGDTLLKEVAKRIQLCVRQSDTIARIGGDEFTILMEGIRLAHIASDISSKILEILSAPFDVSQQEVFISTSIGITLATRETSTDPQTFFKQGDIALYRAKATGRNNFQFYSPDMDKESQERLYLGNSLHRALDRDEFEVYYQLQAAVDNQEIIGAEALLRWQHPQQGTLPTNKFIPLLEETGLISSVSRWLFYRAFSDHYSWQKKGLLHSSRSHISVNLSPRQLRETNLISVFESALRDSKLSGENVVAEITETALLEESPTLSSNLKQLKNLGIKIALDDFGTGYSSLTHIKRFPIDYIKIDQCFIREVLNDDEDRAITRAVIELARSLNITVIAEGVESFETLQCLQEWGCDYFQGYLLNRPCPAQQVEQLMKAPEKKQLKSIITPNLLNTKII